MLTKKQQEVFDEFLQRVQQKENYFLSSEDRGIGKTFTLNELAFTLQALGYKVFVLTPYKDQEYFAESFISLYLPSYRGKFTDNTVFVADESRFEMMDEFLDYCESRKIPVIGYVNFKRSNTVKLIEFE